MNSEKKITPEKALQRLMAQCAQREMCEQHVMEKLRLWEIGEKDRARIMQTLLKGRYIDNYRFAHAYAREKLEISRWGAKKVEMMLRAKGIDSETIAEVMEDCVDDDIQTDNLKRLIEQKRHSLRNETDERKKREKLIRFALSRGYKYDKIVNIL